MSENFNLENLLELTPEMLEDVSGGIMTDKAETVLNALIRTFKKYPDQGFTAQTTIDFVTNNLMDNINFENVTAEDVKEYVTANWDIL